MADALDAVFSFLLAAALAWLLVPVAEAVARRLGAIDLPNPRGLHDIPTPRLGGLAILVAILVAGLIWLPWNAETRASAQDGRWRSWRKRARSSAGLW